jgi:UDP-N-acetyl-D-mannosaminuronic acid dehydrogenase
MQSIVQCISDRSATLGVIGLGTVGLTVAVALADAGFRVVGVDVDEGRVRDVAAARSPLLGAEPELPELLAQVVTRGRLVATSDTARLGVADVVLIAVETPVDEEHRPVLDPLHAACTSVGRVMKPGALVIVESTVAPGTCDNVVAPVLADASGTRLGDGFLLGHCPERVMPGRLLRNLRELPRVCGGASAEACEAMVALYSAIVRARLETTDLVTAELVKTAENAARDVGIAFANELGLICEAVGADFRRVRELVNQSPGRDVLMAGGGVGGHCIPKDPWLLADAVRGKREPVLLAAARAVNDAMPLHVARLVEAALDEANVPLAGARVAVLGYAYLPDSGDARNSPARVLMDRLVGRGANVVAHDPFAEGCVRDLYEAAANASAVVIMVAHSAYRTLDLERLAQAMRHHVLIDARFVVEGSRARQAGFVFRGLGRGER